MEALEWLMQRDPGGRAATRAVGALGDEWLKSPKMVDLCRTLGHRPGANSEQLLQVLIARSPHREVQAHASFAQCQTLKSLLDRSLGSREATAESRERLERQLAALIEKYGDVKDFRGTLKESAEAMLFEIQFLSVGSIPPDIVGDDLDGKTLRLSDFRGKVLLVVFWGTWCGPCMAAVPDHAELLRKLEGKPFAIVGVNSDAEPAAAKKIGAEKGMTWSSWFDGGGTDGAIASRWNVHSWPTMYLLDPIGTIRFKGDMLRASSVRRNAKGENEQYRLVDDYVERLLKEWEGSH